MPFWLKNARATFQRAVNVVLASVKWQCAIVYIDDVIIFTKTPKEHVKYIKEVFGLHMAAGMTLKLKSCHFFLELIDCLGQVIAPGKLKAEKTITEAIKSLRYPRDIYQMRYFLGLCNVYRRFVP